MFVSNKGRHSSHSKPKQTKTKIEAPKKTTPEESTPREEEKPRKSRRSAGTTVVTVVLIVIAALFALAGLLLVGFSLWNRAPEVETDGPIVRATSTPELSPDPSASPKSSASPTPSATPEEDTEESIRREDTYTLLVVGRDRVGMNTDTIMVAQMDCKNKTVNVVSIPRDTLVNVPWDVKKVNSIYGALGIEGLVSGIEDLIGIPIDNYVVVNTYIFQQAIDCLGGVDFDVPMYMAYDDPWQNLHIYLQPGYQHLNGAQSEMLVRFRQNNDGSGYPRGDLQRIEVQQAFFKAAADQLLNMGSIANLPTLIQLVLDNTDTNLTSANIAFYAQEFLKMPRDGINFYTMPYDTVYIRGGSYVSIQLEPWLDIINTFLNPFTVEVTAENLNVITCTENGIMSTSGYAPGFDSFYNYGAG